MVIMIQEVNQNKLAAIKIAGWQPLSLIDYPGKMAAVIFLAGCNMRCHYCHNRQIWDVRQNRLSFTEILEKLRQRVGWLDAVVVSGGEPTIFPDLIPLLRVLRRLNLLIKLDTNGTRPDVVRQVVEQNLVDYVALDIKAPSLKHVAITGVPMQNVLQTAQYLKPSPAANPHLGQTTSVSVKTSAQFLQNILFPPPS